MTTLFSNRILKWRAAYQEYSLVYRMISSLLVACLFSYTTLNGANCTSLHKINLLFEGTYTHFLLIEDDSGELIAIESSECIVDVGSSDSDDSSDEDLCSYCLAMSGGTAIAADLPRFITPRVSIQQGRFFQVESDFINPIVSACSQRGPPQLIYA